MKKIYFFFFSIFAIASIKAQGIDSMMRIYAEQYPQQKVYVHFDKGIYRAGESIWFKAYIFSGFFPASNSRSFHAELIDDRGNVVQRKAYPIAESSVAGNFEIPENFAASNLTFRGYTTWMLNFDSSFYYTKALTVLNKTGAEATPVVRSQVVSLRFFPEGGDLVNTLESVVAFKANDNYGQPVYITGEVKNSRGKIVAALKTIRDGMGTFQFTPALGETYTATYKNSEGEERSAALPIAKNEGVVLKVTSIDDKKIFVVTRTSNASENLKTLYIIAHVAQELLYKAKVPLQRSLVNSGSFPVDKHPSGIMQFTIFSEDWKPVAERISMINNNEFLFNVSVTPVDLNTNKRAKNVFEIDVEDSLLSNLSLSITDERIEEVAATDNIISRLMLTGDLKGYVHNPASYFSNSAAIADIDLVMLTNGWRRYNWSDVALKKLPVIIYPDTSYLSLNAQVFGLSGSTTLRNDEAISAIVQDKDSGYVIIQMPKTGPDKFSQANIIFYDTVSVHYQFAKNRKLEKKVTLKFDNGLYKGFNKLEPAALPLGASSASDVAVGRTRYLGDQIIKFGSSWGNKGNILETVVVKTKAKTAIELLDNKYASGFFSKGDAYTFDLLNTRLAYSDILSFIQAKVPGIRVNMSTGFNEASLTWRNSPTVVYIDEMQVDVEFIRAMSIFDIAYIKVFRPPFFGSFGGGAGGAVAIYTRKGGDAYRIPGKGLAFNRVEGYAEFKEFYSPNYSTRSASADVVADYRSTLYWNPFILTGPGNQKVKFEFYNNDITTAFRVVLEGINEEGRMVRVEKVIRQE